MSQATRVFNPTDRTFAEALDALVYVNPFSPQRLALERQALSSDYQDVTDAWALGPGHKNANLLPLKTRTLRFLQQQRPQLGALPPDELRLYASALRSFIYYDFLNDFETLCRQSEESRFSQRRVTAFERFARAIAELVPDERVREQLFGTMEHLFACQFQVFRGFQRIFGTIIGASRPAQRLRAAAWESVFTYDMRRYERGVYRAMHNVNTLIVGPSGTGKELVARAIGLARYLPFDGQSLRFQEEVTDAFFALNVAALPKTLLESELFGHKRGSFTGAVQDRVGWLEACPEHGTVFLDEVGELELAVQVKLLRTLQSREFQRVGELEPRRFKGKMVSATNRDLAVEIEKGAMREDFYYRLCSDVVETPSLQTQLADCPDDLRLLVMHAARRHFDDQDAADIAVEAERFIHEELGAGYGWPGNVRELEQCVLNVAVRGYYRPSRSHASELSRSAREGLAAEFVAGELDADRLLDVYCTLLYAKTGSFSEAARRLGLDRRTVKARVDQSLLERLR